MGGSTKKVSTAPNTTEKLRGGLAAHLQQGQGFGQMAAGQGYQPQPVNGGAQGFGPTVAAPTAARDVMGQQTQSVDQLGGANSPFFQNMMGQMAPAFDMQRQLAGAAATESAGNLTGSGFANRLGGAMGRTMGDQQARLAEYGMRGVGMEQERQANDANRNLTGQMSNQGADTSFMNQMLDYGRMGQQGNQFGGQLEAQRQAQMASLDANRLSGNANNYTQLLGQQSSAGVGPDQLIQKGGVGALLGPLGAAAGGFFGGPMGQKVGGKIAGGIGKGLGSIFGRRRR